MPTVCQVGPYSFIFFSSDKGEPPHIHVRRDRQLVKFWLQPISLSPQFLVSFLRSAIAIGKFHFEFLIFFDRHLQFFTQSQKSELKFHSKHSSIIVAVAA